MVALSTLGFSDFPRAQSLVWCFDRKMILDTMDFVGLPANFPLKDCHRYNSYFAFKVKYGENRVTILYRYKFILVRFYFIYFTSKGGGETHN